MSAIIGLLCIGKIIQFMDDRRIRWYKPIYPEINKLIKIQAIEEKFCPAKPEPVEPLRIDIDPKTGERYEWLDKII